MPVQRLEKRDLWRNRARELQRRLRDRLRIAVDCHCIRSEDDFHFTYAAIRRWLSRFRDFERDSLKSPSVFYRKRVSKDFSSDEDSILARLLRPVAVPILGNMCYAFMNKLNRVQVYGVEKLHDALLKRPKGKPLLTVSNHVASVDDPFVIASLLPPRVLMDAENLRWTLCATDRCFSNPLASAFFKTVKVLPLSRGDGVYQKGMDMAIAKLNNGGWVHIFPEGSRSRDEGKTLGSPKRGVGRLVLDADEIPIVIPFVHVGMHEIMPIGSKCPKTGKTVTVLVGDPIAFDDLLKDEESPYLYDAVASRIGQRLQQLKARAESLPFMHGAISEASTCSNPDQAISPDGCRWQAESAVNEGGMLWRIRGRVDSFELLGFAARGLRSGGYGGAAASADMDPLKLWKQFWTASLGRQSVVF